MATLDQLNQLALQVPAVTQRAAKQQQAAATVATQAQVGAAPAAAATTATSLAQKAAPGAVAAQGAPLVAAQKAEGAALGQVAQTGLAQQSSDAATALATQQRATQEQLTAQANQQAQESLHADIAMRKRVTGDEQASAKRLSTAGIELDNNLQMMTIRQRQQLAGLGGDIKQQLLDSRLQFERDEIGRKFTNERQLADYNMANAKTQEEFQQKLADMRQAADRKIQLLQVAQAKITQQVEQGFTAEQQLLDNQQKAKLIQIRNDLQAKIRRERAAAANRYQTYVAVGTIAGAIIGGVTTGGAGAAAGASIGGSVGAMAASQDGGSPGQGGSTGGT